MSDETLIDEIFLEVVDLPPEEQEQALAAACPDSQLRRRVERLLGWDSRVPEDFLAGEERVESGVQKGAQVGPYHVLERLGEGGMGTVYAARQSFPEREVALKVLRAGRVSEDAVRRFRHEIDVLGRLQHTGIARIYDAGVTEAPDAFGAVHEVPYFTMELVRGVPLVRHARDSGLVLEQRLELLARVCDAVHYAHQRGVIHRDLKPENVLVTSEESTVSSESGTHRTQIIGQPKVLDFGIARVIDPELAQGTRHTMEGALVGTLTCMSPEQVQGEVQLVDVRTDVYALGVLLYELLCERPPLMLDGLTVPQAAHRIANVEPDAPGDVDPRLRGDLSTIVLKALEKDPERRYQTAFDLAADLRSFLKGEPIEARADSRMYLLRRSLRRHRVMFGVALSFAVLLGVFSVLSVQQARESAELAESEARARALAEEDFASAMAAMALLTELGTDRLRGIPGAEGTRQELLEAALGFHRGLIEAHPDEPELRGRQADSRYRVAWLERDLGNRERALEEVRLAVEEFEAWSADEASLGDTYLLEFPSALCLLGNLLYRSGEVTEAEEHIRRALALCASQLEGGGARDSRALERYAAANRHLSICLRQQGRQDEALEALRSAMGVFEDSMGEDSSISTRAELLALLQQSTLLQFELNQTEGVEEDLLRAIALAETILEEQPTEPRALQDLAGLCSNYGVLLQGAGRIQEAQTQVTQAIETCELLVREHPALARPKEILFDAYNNRVVQRLHDDLEGAIADAARARELMEALQAADPNPSRLVKMASIEHVQATVEIQLERYPEAIELLEATLEHAYQALEVSPGVLETIVLLRFAKINLGMSHSQLRRHERGAEILAELEYVHDGYASAQEVAAVLRAWQTTVHAAEQVAFADGIDLDREIEEYLEQATAYLDAAIEAGFDDLAALPGLGDWQALLEHPPLAEVLKGE